MTLQTDGNAVVYGNNGATWSSHTADHAISKLVMQQDGNLVLFNTVGGSDWASNSAQSDGGPFHLVMQDDGNLVIYNSGGRSIWAIR